MELHLQEPIRQILDLAAATLAILVLGQVEATRQTLDQTVQIRVARDQAARIRATVGAPTHLILDQTMATGLELTVKTLAIAVLVI